MSGTSACQRDGRQVGSEQSLRKWNLGVTSHHHRMRLLSQVICVRCCGWMFPSCTKPGMALLGQMHTIASHKYSLTRRGRSLREPCVCEIGSSVTEPLTERMWRQLIPLPSTLRAQACNISSSPPKPHLRFPERDYRWLRLHRTLFSVEKFTLPELFRIFLLAYISSTCSNPTKWFLLNRVAHSTSSTSGPSSISLLRPPTTCGEGTPITSLRCEWIIHIRFCIIQRTTYYSQQRLKLTWAKKGAGEWELKPLGFCWKCIWG